MLTGIDGYHLAGHGVCVNQIGERPGNVGGLDLTGQWGGRDFISKGRGRLVNRGEHGPRAYGIDPNLWGQIQSQHLGRGPKRAFGERVAEKIGPGAQDSLVENIDDQTGPIGGQSPGKGLGQNQRCAQIGLKMGVPGGAIVVGETVALEHRGAIDQEGYGTQFSLDLADQGCCGGLLAQVTGMDRGLAAQSADLSGRGLRVIVGDAAMQGDVKACLTTGQAERATDAAGCPGDQGSSAKRRHAGLSSVEAAKLNAVQREDDAQKGQDNIDAGHDGAPRFDPWALAWGRLFASALVGGARQAAWCRPAKRDIAMPLTEIAPSDFTKIAVGIDRPEDVVVGRDGRIFASDHQSAVAEIFADGSFIRMGPQDGAPNGINMDRQGRILIANFGIYDRQDNGPLQRYDPATGVHETLLTHVEGHCLNSSNYPVMDRAGNIWCANSTDAESWPKALDGRNDGFLFVLRPDGSSQKVAVGLKFPNGLALSADEAFLFCAQTTGADVLRFPVLAGGLLGRGERYGPVLGELHQPGKPAPPTEALGYTDGIGFDFEGNLWVCLPGANKIVAITPGGEMVLVAHDPGGDILNHPTNVTWGGPDLKDLYIGSIRADYVLKACSPVAGQPQVHQQD